MTTPQRIQRRRTRGWTMPPGAIYVGRPGRYGNPFRVGALNGSAGRCVELYRAHLAEMRAFDPEWFAAWLAPLRGHDLACWCPLTNPDGTPYPCHATVLLALANEDVTP